MKKKICVICLLALLSTGCGKVPKLSNGDDAVVSFNNGEMISVNDLYEQMKDSFALESLVTMIDTYILETEFEDYIDAAKEQAESMISYYVSQYGGEEEVLSLVQQSGYSTIEAYQNYLYLSFMQQNAINEYAKLQITDKELEDYYENDIQGDVEISHILIVPDVDDDMEDEEKTEAENKAKETINEIINKLKEAEDVEATFEEFAKEYSEDSSTASKGGDLGRITYGDLSDSYDELLDAAYKLKTGAYSTSVITTELGYHVILKTNQYDKESLEDLKEEMLENLAQEYISANSDVSLRALQHYRKEYGMEVQDSELSKQYSNYIQNALASIAEQQQSSAE